MFNIIVSGGSKYSPNSQDLIFDSVQQVDGNNFDDVKSLVSMTLGRYSHKTVYCRGAIYVFAGYDNNNKVVTPVEKYSLITNTWEDVANMPDNRLFLSFLCFYAEHFYYWRLQYN